jgi:cytochrome b561
MGMQDNSPTRYGNVVQPFHWLAGLHALAAIYHHVMLKDGVQESMLPGWNRLPSRRVR